MVWALQFSWIAHPLKSCEKSTFGSLKYIKKLVLNYTYVFSNAISNKYLHAAVCGAQVATHLPDASVGLQL